MSMGRVAESDPRLVYDELGAERRSIRDATTIAAPEPFT
jgi:hypothetical protein